MFFDGWQGLARVALASVCAYVGLLVFLRISGKRTLGKLNAFDFVVTVALGSTLSNVAISKNVPLAEGLLAMGMLILLQYVVAWTQIRSDRFQTLVKSEPRLLLYRGKLQVEAMRAERVTEAEVKAAIRSSGGSDLSSTFAVILETDGSLSSIASADEGVSALSTVRNIRGNGSGELRVVSRE